MDEEMLAEFEALNFDNKRLSQMNTEKNAKLKALKKWQEEALPYMKMLFLGKSIPMDQTAEDLQALIKEAE